MCIRKYSPRNWCRWGHCIAMTYLLPQMVKFNSSNQKLV